MVKDLEIRGKWWLPEKEDLKLDGTLTFSLEKGILLEIHGFYKNVKESYEVDELFRSPEIILGLSYEGEKVASYKCWKSHFHHLNTSFIFILTL